MRSWGWPSEGSLWLLARVTPLGGQGWWERARDKTHQNILSPAVAGCHSTHIPAGHQPIYVLTCHAFLTQGQQSGAEALPEERKGREGGGAPAPEGSQLTPRPVPSAPASAKTPDDQERGRGTQLQNSATEPCGSAFGKRETSAACCGLTFVPQIQMLKS